MAVTKELLRDRIIDNQRLIEKIDWVEGNITFEGCPQIRLLLPHRTQKEIIPTTLQ